jgi:hypothetical protein
LYTPDDSENDYDDKKMSSKEAEDSDNSEILLPSKDDEGFDDVNSSRMDRNKDTLKKHQVRQFTRTIT